ncbi:MAG: Diguanylate cyclase/phosphodiesterase [Ilumatobacteraceae bacterium]|nr:Diguanylate cyclase/phosphodiesterase [Ilumatobacteraceae bacterium]
MLVFVTSATASIAGLTVLVDNVHTRSEQSSIATAEVVIALSVHRDVTPHAFRPGSTLTAAEAADLDGDVAVLVRAHRLIDLVIWSLDGRLIYSDPARPADRAVLSDAEVRRIKEREGWVASSSAAGSAVRNVYVPYDAGLDGVNDGLIELVIPGASFDDAIATATRELYALAALLIAISGLSLFVLRRRLVKRDHAGSHDRLTNLLNWSAFYGVILESVSGKGADPGSAAVLLIGLDRFRTVNESFGRPSGDHLLRLVAANLSAHCATDARVGRVGGDEFAVVVNDFAGDTGSATADRLLERLHAARFEIAGVSIAVEASIGVAPITVSDGDELLRRADVAMHVAKRAGSGIAVYDPADDHRNVQELTLLGELRHAIEHHQLTVHYQPQADLVRHHIDGVEALVRWNHPVRGLLAPDMFIPLAERSGLLWPLTQWVLARSIQDAARWYREGLSLAVAVNVSPRGLFQENMPNVVAELLRRHQLPGALLEIEILETAIVTDAKRSSAVLHELRALGVRVALDDFGTGYTSLAYLKSLPVDTLKIDRSFITELLDDPKGHSVVQSMIELGHRLGLNVLAEGIENQETWDELERLGCDVGQGFLLARPMPSERVAPWVSAHRSRGLRTSSAEENQRFQAQQPLAHLSAGD